MISAVVLAAGKAERMGTVKQLLPWHGKPLLQHAVDNAVSADEVVVVLGHAAPEIEAALELPSHARIVINDRFSQGQATSLHTGLSGCSDASEAAVVFLGDNPAVDPHLLVALVADWRGSGASVVRTRYLDRPGHPVLLAKEIWDELDDSGDEGARSYIDAHPDAVHDHEVATAAPIDVDDSSDYESLLQA